MMPKSVKLLDRFLGLLGGVCLGAVLALIITFTGAAKEHLFPMVETNAAQWLILIALFVLLPALKGTLGFIFPRVFTFFLVPFWILFSGSEDDGPFFRKSPKNKPQDSKS